MRRRSQKGAGLTSLALPLLSSAIVPIGKTVGKAVLGGIASQGIGSLFKKVLGGKRKRKRKNFFKRKVTFRRYLKA